MIKDSNNNIINLNHNIKNIPRFDIGNIKNLSLDKKNEEGEEVIKISDSDDDNEINLINNKKKHNLILTYLSSENIIKSLNTNKNSIEHTYFGKKTYRNNYKKK